MEIVTIPENVVNIRPSDPGQDNSLSSEKTMDSATTWPQTKAEETKAARFELAGRFTKVCVLVSCHLCRSNAVVG